MSLVNLKNGLNTGIKGLDYEHRKIVGLMETICDDFSAAEAAGTVSEGFGELFANVSAHFALEETLMRNSGYPGYEAHRAHHEQLLERIRLMMDSWEDGKCVDCGMGLRSCLEDWLSEHVRTMDAGLRDLAQ